ncbi:hypothetical protein [Vibrio jasicida]|uniref:hypothetical protein n=1 Tax=Vibrio jasicida TaxID=766224 RepID=UPI000CE3C68B|nr:hypothetical protein [Vibrio jasicida]
MKKVFKVATAALISAATLGGCSVYNAVQDVSMFMDYEVGNETIFNSDNGSQFIVAKHRNESENKILVCYQNDGLLGSTAEEPLREVANEWLGKNYDMQFAATESKNRSGVWEARTCYEFHYEQVEARPHPIGAYLDEETGEVVIVGEHTEEEKE